MRPLPLLLGLCLLSSAAWDPPRAQAFCRVSVGALSNAPCDKESSSPRLFWDRGCYSYRFNRNVFERIDGLEEFEIRAIFDEAFITWEDVDCGFVPFVVEQSETLAAASMPEFLYDTRNEAIITALDPEEWTELDPPQRSNAFAVTFLWHDTKTGELLDVDIALNLQQGPFGDCGDTPCTGERLVDLQNTITHEAGHAMGLGHSEFEASTMFPDVEPGAIYMRDLDVDDENGLCAIQLPSHDCGDPDDVSCVCPPPPLVLSVVESPSSCGCRVVGARGGDGSTPGALGLGLAGLLLLWRRRRDAQR